MIQLWGVALLFLCTLIGVKGIYEDDVGKEEWYMANLGRVTHAVPPLSEHHKSHKSDGTDTLRQAYNSIVVGSEQGVIASLDLARGAVKWRRMISGDFHQIRHLQSGSRHTLIAVGDVSPAASTTAQNTRPIITSISALTGELIWQREMVFTEENCGEVLDNVACKAVDHLRGVSDLALVGSFDSIGSLYAVVATPRYIEVREAAKGSGWSITLWNKQSVETHGGRLGRADPSFMKLMNSLVLLRLVEYADPSALSGERSASVTPVTPSSGEMRVVGVIGIEPTSVNHSNSGNTIIAGRLHLIDVELRSGEIVAHRPIDVSGGNEVSIDVIGNDIKMSIRSIKSVGVVLSSSESGQQQLLSVDVNSPSHRLEAKAVKLPESKDSQWAFSDPGDLAEKSDGDNALIVSNGIKSKVFWVTTDAATLLEEGEKDLDGVWIQGPLYITSSSPDAKVTSCALDRSGIVVSNSRKAMRVTRKTQEPYTELTDLKGDKSSNDIHPTLVMGIDVLAGKHPDTVKRHLVISSSDHSFSNLATLVSGARKLMWAREEALAGIRGVVLLDVPEEAPWIPSRSESSTLVEQLNSFLPGLYLLSYTIKQHMMISTWRGYVRHFEEWLEGPLTTPRSSFKSNAEWSYYISKIPGVSSATDPENTRTTSSKKGGRVLVARTCANQLFGIDAATGAILWKSSFVPSTSDTWPAVAPPGRCFPSLDASNFEYSEGIGNGGSSFVMHGGKRVDPHSDGMGSKFGDIMGVELIDNHVGLVVRHLKGKTILNWFDPANGTPIAKASYEMDGLLEIVVVPQAPRKDEPKHKRSATFTHSHHAHSSSMVVAFDRQAKTLRLLQRPDLESKPVVKELSHFHFFEYDTSSLKLSGYRPAFDETTQLDALSIGSSVVWSINFGEASERVIAMSGVVHGSHGHIPVLVQSDISLLYKYINKNQVAVVTEDSEGSLTLYLVNSIGGAVVYSAVLPIGATLPMRLLMYDNFVLVHYWNFMETHNELHVIELFDSEKDKGPWDVMFSTVTHHHPTRSALDLKTPVAFNATYITPSGVRTMGTSVTSSGITPRSLIMGLASNQVLTIPWQLISARRPLPIPGEKPKPAKKEDGPIYTPVLPKLAKNIISLSHEVWNTRGIATFPTMRESTSLVFAYGLDLFYSPHAPAKSFDSLTPTGQWKAGIIVAFGGIFVGVIITSKMVRRSQLKARWK
eukprot:GHVN01068355.1.p1 GENE.GHVN01068355.1~~GHVN01068355.1.p1  ORF type:complete len:1202 (-),score=188.62 GHVN01068355.1:1431-5036(-)